MSFTDIIEMLKIEVKKEIERYHTDYLDHLEECDMDTSLSNEDIHDEIFNWDGMGADSLSYHCGYVEGIRHAEYLISKQNLQKRIK